MSTTLERVRQLVASRDIRVSDHGYEELIQDDLTVHEIVSGVGSAILVEDYPDFPKGPSALVLQHGVAGQPIHVVWGIPRGHNGPAVLVTAYRPDPSRWDASYTERRR